MKIEILGKFYDNQSLSIINRNISINLSKKYEVGIIPLDAPSTEHKLRTEDIDSLIELQKPIVPDVQIRHSYPPIWNWPEYNHTKVVYIQPWEYSSMPSEWQYKFDTFADAVIVPSEWNASVYKSSGINPNKIFVVPNGYDELVFYKANNKNTNTIRFVYVGCAQFRKGIDVLLGVWSQLTKKHENVELVIKDTPQVYGANNLLQDILTLQYKTGCAKITYIDESLTDTQMADLYRSCDIVIHPYRGEGFGMHIQEAMACGCLPIVTSGGPTDEFVEDYKIKSSRRVINPYDIFALKQGDSMSNMGQHRWVLEPDAQDLANLIRKCMIEYKDKRVNSKRLTNWSDATTIYEKVLLKINSVESTRREKS
jgi:glycosyltransferase involved in cell wall biosynthesis